MRKRPGPGELEHPSLATTIRPSWLTDCFRGGVGAKAAGINSLLFGFPNQEISASSSSPPELLSAAVSPDPPSVQRSG